MREALTTTVNNRNQVDDDWSMQECLSRFLKIETLKSEQSEALEALISRREVIVILPTGFRASLFFFTPLLSCAFLQARETVRSLYSWLLG